MSLPLEVIAGPFSESAVVSTHVAILAEYILLKMRFER